MEKQEVKKVVKREPEIGRRKFLKTAAAAAGAATVATVGFPMVSRAETTILKMQGSWGAKDIFNEYGVQIMSPHYINDPPEPFLVPPEHRSPPPAPAEDPVKVETEPNPET